MNETPNGKTCAVFQNARNRKLVAELEKVGRRVVSMPCATLKKTDAAQTGNFSIGETADFDWIIFTDVFAVEFFLEFAAENNFDLYELDDLKICALGESVADRLRYAQVHSDVIPADNSAGKIVAEISDYVYDEKALGKQKFLVLKEAGERFGFVGELEKRNACVREAAVYRAEPAHNAELPKIKALVKGGAIDEMIFNAPEDFLQFKFIFREEHFAEILDGVEISVADETTRRILRENKISVSKLLG